MGVAPTVVRYRWDRYLNRREPGPWYDQTTSARFARALRALRMPGESIRAEFSNGQTVIYCVKEARKWA